MTEQWASKTTVFCQYTEKLYVKVKLHKDEACIRLKNEIFFMSWVDGQGVNQYAKGEINNLIQLYAGLWTTIMYRHSCFMLSGIDHLISCYIDYIWDDSHHYWDYWTIDCTGRVRGGRDIRLPCLEDEDAADQICLSKKRTFEEIGI